VPETQIFVAVLVALALGVRASWVWLFKGRTGVSLWRGTLGSLAISLVLLDCLCFIGLCCRGEIGGFGTHYITTRSIGWWFLGSLLATAGASLVKGESRWETMASGLLTTALWFGAANVA
jgi:hypothetical protein